MILLEKEINRNNLIKFVYTTIGNKNGDGEEESILVTIDKTNYNNNTYQIKLEFPKDISKNLTIDNLSYQQVQLFKLISYLDSIEEVVKIINYPMTYFTDMESANDFLNLDFGRLLTHTNIFFGKNVTDVNYKVCYNSNLNRDCIEVGLNRGKDTKLPYLSLNSGNIIELKNNYFYLKLDCIYNEAAQLMKTYNIDLNVNNFIDLVEWFRNHQV